MLFQDNPFGDLKSLRPEDNRFVKQGSLIAVSYEARAKGVKRNMRGAEARKACPDLILVQVPTSHGKADLTIYREASARIISVLGSHPIHKDCIVERASIDEVYVDVSEDAAKLLAASTDDELRYSLERLRTSASPNIIAGEDSEEIKMSKRQLSSGHSGTAYSHALAAAAPDSSWFDRPFHEWSTEDKYLLCGAIVVQSLREEVFRQLGFTCSAGVATNKMLAKIASGMHKPNKQTLVPPVAVKGLMRELPYSRVPGFGGKLGQTLSSEFGDRVQTLGDLLEK